PPLGPGSPCEITLASSIRLSFGTRTDYTKGNKSSNAPGPPQRPHATASSSSCSVAQEAGLSARLRLLLVIPTPVVVADTLNIEASEAFAWDISPWGYSEDEARVVLLS